MSEDGEYIFFSVDIEKEHRLCVVLDYKEINKLIKALTELKEEIAPKSTNNIKLKDK